jgi:hypothetical protein
MPTVEAAKGRFMTGGGPRYVRQETYMANLVEALHGTGQFGTAS